MQATCNTSAKPDFFFFFVSADAHDDVDNYLPGVGSVVLFSSLSSASSHPAVWRASAALLLLCKYSKLGCCFSSLPSASSHPAVWRASAALLLLCKYGRVGCCFSSLSSASSHPAVWRASAALLLLCKYGRVGCCQLLFCPKQLFTACNVLYCTSIAQYYV
jgi:hypothetical protein